MNRWPNNKSLNGLICVVLLLLSIYLLQLLKPTLANSFQFLQAVLGPFLVAMIISYVLNPIVNILNQRKMPRTIAVLLIYAIFVASVYVVVINISPILISQIKELNQHMPELSARANQLMDGIYENKNLPESIKMGIHDSLQRIEMAASEWVAQWLNDLDSTLNLLFLAFIIPFLAFYMLKDVKMIEKTALTLVPGHYRKPIIRLAVNIDTALGHYIRGQFLVCVMVGTLAFLGYWLIGLPYPLLLASLVAVFNIIPYLGPFFGAAPALLVASTISLKMLLFVAIVNVGVQILEGNVIGPQIVGKSLHLHPLMIILALLIGGELAGIAGLILAVPILAALKVTAEHIINYVLQRKRIS